MRRASQKTKKTGSLEPHYTRNQKMDRENFKLSPVHLDSVFELMQIEVYWYDLYTFGLESKDYDRNKLSGDVLNKLFGIDNSWIHYSTLKYDCGNRVLFIKRLIPLGNKNSNNNKHQ